MLILAVVAVTSASSATISAVELSQRVELYLIIALDLGWA